MLVFFDAQGLVQSEFIPKWHTVKKEMRVEILGRLRDVVRKKHREILALNSWFRTHLHICRW
jgi:hypothetical protein